MVFFVSTVNTH